MRTTLAVLLLGVLVVVACEDEGGGAKDSDQPAVCLTTIPCAGDSDCPEGHRCNEAVAPPACQLLYCGQLGAGCSLGVFCESGVCDGASCVCSGCATEGQSCTTDGMCDSGKCGVDGKCTCKQDCGWRECGVDPACGLSCGTCDGGKVCQENRCVDVTPEDVVDAPNPTIYEACMEYRDVACEKWVDCGVFVGMVECQGWFDSGDGYGGCNPSMTTEMSDEATENFETCLDEIPGYTPCADLSDPGIEGSIWACDNWP